MLRLVLATTDFFWLKSNLLVQIFVFFFDDFYQFPDLGLIIIEIINFQYSSLNKLSNYMGDKLTLLVWFIRAKAYLVRLRIHPERFFWCKNPSGMLLSTRSFIILKVFSVYRVPLLFREVFVKSIVRNHLTVMNLLTLTRVNKMDIHHINFIHKWSLATAPWKISGEIHQHSFHGGMKNR